MCVARHAQNTQSKKNMKDEVDFVHADKRQRFLQVDTIILGVCGKACPNYPKN